MGSNAARALGSSLLSVALCVACSSEREVTIDDIDTLGELESQQIFRTALQLEFLNGDEEFEAVFDVADEGTYYLLTLNAGDADYDWVKLYAGDTEVGVIFAAGTLQMVGEVSDGDVMGCE